MDKLVRTLPDHFEARYLSAAKKNLFALAPEDVNVLLDPKACVEFLERYYQERYFASKQLIYAMLMHEDTAALKFMFTPPGMLADCLQVSISLTPSWSFTAQTMTELFGPKTPLSEGYITMCGQKYVVDLARYGSRFLAEEEKLLQRLEFLASLGLISPDSWAAGMAESGKLPLRLRWPFRNALNDHMFRILEIRLKEGGKGARDTMPKLLNPVLYVLGKWATDCDKAMHQPSLLEELCDEWFTPMDQVEQPHPDQKSPPCECRNVRLFATALFDLLFLMDPDSEPVAPPRMVHVANAVFQHMYESERPHTLLACSREAATYVQRFIHYYLETCAMPKAVSEQSSHMV